MKQFNNLTILFGLVFTGLFLIKAGDVLALDCTSNATGNWSAAGTWANCGGVVPDEDDTATITHTVTIDASATTTAVTINGGGALQFQTTGAGVTLAVNEGGTNLLTVGAAATAGTLTCRAPASGVNTIRLNSTSSDAAVGIQVESMGKLDIQGTSASDQDCLITNGGATLDGTRDGYIYLKDGSETIIKYAEVSYMGTVASTKYGIGVYAVDGNVASEGFYLEGSKIHHNYYGIVLSGSNYNQIINNEIYSSTADDNIYLSGSTYNLIYENILHDGAGDGITTQNSSHYNVISNNISYSNTYGIYIGNGDNNNTVINNITHNNTLYGILVRGDNNYVYNNTVNTNGTYGIYIYDSTNDNNIVKNNIITNHSGAGDIGISNSGTGTVIDYNYFYNNTTDCSGTCSPNTLAAGSGNDPNFATTSTTSADFMYLDSDETPTAGPLGAGVELWGATPTVPGYINVGARLDYVKNITDDEEFNWLQDAHDDATSDVLSAGDTVTTYAKNYFSDTITATSTFGNYYFKFNISSTGNITADNNYEGTYIYFTSGINKGKYYLIVDSTNGSPDTITDQIPDGTVYVDGSTTGGGTYDGTKVSWTIASLPADQSGTVSFKVRVE